jgi:hypothetical protein
MQGRGAVDDGDGAPGAGDFFQHALEAVDELADRGHEGALDAFLEIGDFIAGEHRLVQRQRAVGYPHGALNGSNDPLHIEAIGFRYRNAHIRLIHCRRQPCSARGWPGP